ncbi:TATA element modulatory factor-like isoform X3 [Littorina saxatilis]|uniref:TATA element modulatory factor 1 TATA binding domain-containing protein n=1 Tax=Littorina saxatilis TaxID=31220 RepID=A0AAN9GL83_9CAEN
MSWWDPKAFSLSKAFKTAQEQIDKVLDIQGEEGGKGKGAAEKSTKPAAAPSTGSPEAAASQDETESNSWNSWSSWMTPKTPGDSDAKEADTSGSPSSWGVASGTKDDSSSKTDAARLTSVSKGRTAKPSASRKLDLHTGDSKQNTTSVSEEEDSRAVKTESSPQGEKSKEKEESVGGSRLSPELTADEGGTDTSVGDVKRETVPAEPESREPSPVEQERLFDHVPAADTDVEISEREDPMLTAGEEDVTLRLTEAESGLTAGNNAEGLGGGGAESADSSIPEVLVEEDCEKADSGESAEPVLSSSADHFGTAREPIPTDLDASQGWDSQSNAPVVADSNVSQTSTSLEEAFETFPKDSSSRETMESYETATSASSSETLISREASFTQISVSEDVQAASVSSVSSEPVLLSMSTDDNNVTQEEEVTWPDAGLFNPLDHSHAVSESEIVRISSPVDVLSLQEEQASPVCSPPLDSTATVSSNDSSETSRLDSSAETVIDRSQQLFEETAGDKAGSEEADESQHWMGESSLIDLGAASSPSASFVKCMIEDAMGMEDASNESRHEDSGSDNHSEEKSDGSKGDSEFEKSIYSGHESNDEIETTTSSDIEIISTPTPNGGENIVDLSPLQFTLQSRAARQKAQCHHRSDSQSSSSTHSKGDIDHLSPEREDWHREDDDLDNPQHPQRLLKSSVNQQDKDVVKKLAEMAEVLQARENKLVQLSKDNNDFLEANSILRSQLHQAEEEQNAKMADLTALTEEFSRRMGESERKNQAILKEKETLKQQLQSAQSQLAKKAEDTNLEAMLIEKDEQITGLMEEGEKLSKQQLQNSNIIKKLRSKEKENEGLIASQKKKVEQQKEELDRLKIVLDSKEDMEKKQADVIKQLNAAVQAMEKEKAKLTVEVESADEKIRGLQATLDNSYKEIAELHKSNATQDSRAQQAALSAEMQVREELKMNIEQQRQQHQREREALIMQIEDLRMSLARMEKEHSRREEMLKQENSDLQMRLQEDESRSQDLTQSVTSATRPLLRQIENLQATHSIQAAAWERVERNLAERLSDAQTLLALAQEKERSATEKLAEVSSRCAALEASNSQLRKEKAQLTAQQENDRRRIDMLEERRASDIAQLELAKQKLSEEVASIRKDKVFLEQQLETERNRLEAEKQRVSVAEEQIRIMERERPRSRGTPSPVSVSRQESVNSSFSERSSTPTWLQRQDDGEGFMMATPSGPKTSLYDSMRNSGASALMENLHSQLKLREGEISQLQAEIQQLERTRESMARELVNLTNQNEELQDEVKELPKLRAEYQGLNGRYNALLQMYGEKEEQVQELRLDLDDVKEMYKQQINSLMQ